MEKFADFVLKKPWLAVLAVVALVALSIASALHIRFDNTPDSFFMKNDAALKLYSSFKADFGSDEYSFIVLNAPDTWDASFINRVRTLTDSLKSMKNVNRVTSITNVRHIAGKSGTIAVGDFLPASVPENDLAAKRREAMEHPFYRNFLISADGKKLGILAETALRPNEVQYKIELTNRMRELIASPEYKDFGGQIVGAPVIDRDVFYLINLESAIFGTLSFILVAAGFYFIFRSWLGAMLPLAVASLSIVVAFGIMALVSAPVGMLTPIIPSFLISVGVASSVFLMTEIYQARIHGATLPQAIRTAFRDSAATSAASVLTTAAALFTFSSSDIKPVQDVGVVMACGLIASLVIALLLIPAALSRKADIAISPRVRDILTGRIRAMERLATMVTTHWKRLLLLLGILLALAAYGASQVRTDYFYVGLFKERSDIRKAYDYVDQSLRGSAALELVFDTSAMGADAIKEPAVLREMHALQQRLEQQFPALSVNTYSVADVVMEINQALHDGKPEFYRIPDSKREIAEALFLFESSGNDELNNMIAGDYSRARINVRVKYRPDSEYQPLFAYVDSYAKNELPQRLEKASIAMTGVIPLWSRLTGYLSQTEIETISYSALIVLAAMIYVFRSLWIALVMAACNLIPVLFTLAAMGYLGVFLDPFTLLVSAIAIGVLDDDTIHFVKSVLNHYRREGDMKRALAQAYAGAGQAMLMLSAVLVCGFLVYTLSQVASLAKFGAMTATAIGFGALCEFFFTPAVLIACERLGLLKAEAPDSPASAAAARS